MTDYDQDKPSMMMRRGEGDDEDKIFAQILKFYHEFFFLNLNPSVLHFLEAINTEFKVASMYEKLC